MRSLLGLSLVVVLIAVCPRGTAAEGGLPDSSSAATKSMTATEKCFVDREECLETCTYHEDESQIPDCNKACRVKFSCGKLEHANHVARSLED